MNTYLESCCKNVCLLKLATMSQLSKRKLPVRSSRKAVPLTLESKLVIERSVRATQETAVDDILALEAANGGTLPHGAIQDVIDKFDRCGFGHIVTRNIIDYRLKLRNDGKRMMPNGNNVPVAVTIPDVVAPVSPLAADSPRIVDDANGITDAAETSPAVVDVRKNVGGRKKGSTKKRKVELDQKHREALTAASVKYKEARRAADKGKLPDGTLDKIITVVEDEYELEHGTLSRHTILNRFKSNNMDGIPDHKISPLIGIEPLLVEIIIKLGLMNAPLNRSGIIDLAEDMARGTEHEKKLRDFCAKRGMPKGEESLVGIGWYEGFLNRNQDTLTRKKVQIRDSCRSSWCTVEHFTNMYNTVYDAMVDCGVAELLENEVMYDKDGNETNDASLMVGRPSKYRLIKPELCLFMDETGCNTNQKDDGFAGGEKFVVSVDQIERGRSGTTTDLHFTVLPFIAGTGEAVMCALVMKSEKDIKDIPIQWRYGIDIRKNVAEREDSVEMFEINQGEGKSLAGGPTCRFNGKDVPCFVCATPKSSITTDLLIKMLTYIDKKGLFPRVSNERPFLLLDGHQSRTKLEFLEYITDDNHAWCCCLGVPYGTHIWQPADSSELNGSFKIAFSKAKIEYQKYKPSDNKAFSPTDIIPILNMAWGKSLGNKRNARKAIVDRGWATLNYVLLDDPRLKSNTKKSGNDDSTASTESSSIDSALLLASINKEGKAFMSCVDALLEEQLKSEGRQRAFAKMQLEAKEHKRKIDRLKDITNITSTKLAANNYYHLDKDLRDKFREKHEKMKEVDEQKANKRMKRNNQDEEKFRIAAVKYKAGGQKDLLSGDMRALMKRLPPLPKDSPLKLRVGDLTEQLNRRCRRLNLFLDPLYYFANNAEIVNNDDQTALTILSDVVSGEQDLMHASNSISTTGNDVVVQV